MEYSSTVHSSGSEPLVNYWDDQLTGGTNRSAGAYRNTV